MPLVGLLKGKDKFYLFSDNCQYLGGSVFVKKAPRQYHIQKFKNLVIAYHGDAPTFQKLVQRFDFNAFPINLTRSYLLRNFYVDFLDFLTKETKCKYEDGALIDSDFGLMMMGKDFAFDVGSEYLYEVNEFNAYGDDRLAFHLYNNFVERLDEETLVKEIIAKSVKYAYRTSYPFLLVTSDDLDHLKVIDQDHQVTVEPLNELWRND